MPKKLTFKFVKQYFEDRDCELYETEYINCDTPMRYRCKCGNKKCSITFSKFKKGQRCKKCSKMRKFTFKEVKQYFKDHDCKLLATEYISATVKMEYECSCGNPDCKISFGNFRQGRRCNECGRKKSAKKQRFLFKDVKQYFEDHDCKLIATEYINSRTLMEYECNCGNSDCRITFSCFKQGKRCMECAIERRTGKNNCNYNPNLTDEERENDGSRPGCKKWRKSILKRDNNTSQCCFQEEGKLCAHHIEAYTPNKELRTVISNGFLFCENHHKEFHKKYGYDCNREQLEDFLKNIK